jgi:hypothetical protein
MTQLFDRLGYDYTSGNGIIEFSDTTKNTLNSFAQTAPLLDEWQMDALINGDVESSLWLKNPVANIVNSVISVCANLASICSQSGTVVGLGNLLSVSQNVTGYVINTGTEESPVLVEIEGTGEKFFDHTQRLSGLVDPNEETVLLPHYDIALGVGKSIMYLINQADGIANNAPVLGSFTSVFIEKELNEKYEIIKDYPQIVSASISCTTSGDENSVTTCSSNLTSQQITNIVANVNYFNITFETRRIHDENFFTNSKIITDDYQKMRRFKNMGESERELTNNYLGTPKLLANTNPST